MYQLDLLLLRRCNEESTDLHVEKQEMEEKEKMKHVCEV